MNITIKNLEFSAVIARKGAELISFKKNNNKEYIWDGNPAFWGKHSPVLFPIVGTLKNDSYTYKDKTYHLSRHGFARDMEFEATQTDENQVVFTLKSNSETEKMYPFEFELHIIYTLEQNNLNIAYKVINLDKVIIPFS